MLLLLTVAKEALKKKTRETSAKGGFKDIKCRVEK